jgi:hypothetical protein
MGVDVNATPGYLTTGKSLGTHCSRLGGSQGRSGEVLAKRESLDPTGDRTPDRPVHCESLYKKSVILDSERLGQELSTGHSEYKVGLFGAELSFVTCIMLCRSLAIMVSPHCEF